MPRPALAVAPSLKVALYLRVSDEKQATQDLSIPSQLKALREHCHRKGWEITAEYVDEARSGRTDKREAFQEMIAAAKSPEPPFTAIIAWKLDRFARNREHAVLYKAQLRKRGIQVLSLNESFDDSPAGRFSEGILESVAQFFSENLSADVRRGLRYNARMGNWNGGTPPPGYLTVTQEVNGKARRRLIPDPQTAPMVQTIFRLYLAGHGIPAIHRQLVDQGIPATDCHRSRLYRILSNPIYAGTLTYGRTRVATGTSRQHATQPEDWQQQPGAVEPLVSAEDFARAQERLRSRQRFAQHPRVHASRYLLTGLLFCGQCGATMMGYKGGDPAKRYYYYRCTRAVRKLTQACPRAVVAVSKIDPLVLADLQQLAGDTPTLTVLVAEANAAQAEQHRHETAALTKIDAQQQAVGKRLARLYEALESGTLGYEELGPRIRELQGQQRALEQQKAAHRRQQPAPLPPLTVAEVRRQLQTFGRVFARKSREEQHALLRELIERIEVAGGKVRVRYTLGLTRELMLPRRWPERAA